MKKRIYIAMAALAAGTMLTVGCAKKSTEWVMAEGVVYADGEAEIGRPWDRPNAPDWVRGLTPQSDSRIYFVGRSNDSFDNLSEYDALQSARHDIDQQIRDRLKPEQLGNSSQKVDINVDSGTCSDCGHQLSTANPNSNCASCLTLVHAVNDGHRSPDYLPHDTRIARDLNVFNVGVDSVMPALLSQLQEETVYFELVWWVEFEASKQKVAFAARDGRKTVTVAGEKGKLIMEVGNLGHRAWILSSIPREEFSEIATEFRGRYEELYDMALDWTVEDRQRRVEWETNDRRTELERQAEERAWNREDEIITRDHTITLDKDRHPMPGRRFGVVGSQ